MSTRHLLTSVLNVAIVMALLIVLIARPLAAQSVYSITDLGTFGGPTSAAYGINNAGQVVGQADGFDASGSPVTSAFLYSGGNLQNLGTLGGTWCQATGINDYEQIVGTSSTPAIFARAFAWNAGQMHMLALPSSSDYASWGYGINNKGQIVGAVVSSVTPRACIWNNGVPTDLDSTIDNSLGTSAQAINDTGQITGYVQEAGGTEGFIWQAGKKPIYFGSGIYSEGDAINRSGQVAGWVQDVDAALWSKGVLTDFGAAYSLYSVALGINTSGQIVGMYILNGTLSTSHAFLYSGSQFTDLNTLIPGDSGWVLQYASGINDAGQIAGYGISPSGQTHAFLLSPATSSLPNSVLTMTTRDPGSNTDRKVDGIVCDNPPGVTSNRNFLRITSNAFKGMTIISTLSNPDGSGTDTDGSNNVGQAVVSNGMITYYPPDEFNYWQHPTDTSHLTASATRTVYLNVTLKASDGSLTVVAPLPIILARPPVVLVHGINSDPSDWKPMQQAIASSMTIPFVAVNHCDPTHLDYLGQSNQGMPPEFWLFHGNEPAEVGAYLLGQRIEKTLFQERSGLPISDADQNSLYTDSNGQLHDEVNLSSPYTTSDGSYTYILAARRVDVVAWSYGGVITRWYLAASGTSPALWYQHHYPLTLPNNTQVDFATSLPSISYGQDVRKVITIASMWRGVPLANYLNETLFPPVNGIDLGLAPVVDGATDLAVIVAALPILTQVPSMEVMAVNSKWLSQLIFQNPIAGLAKKASPFVPDILYGSVAGVDNAYLGNVPYLGGLIDPYTTIDLAQQPSWFPYLGLEYVIGLPAPNYTDGLVPVWSAFIPGTATTSVVVAANHSTIPTDPGTIAYLEQWLNNASLPSGKALNPLWDTPLKLNMYPNYTGYKEWQYHAGEMAPHTQNNVYRPINGVGRLNSLALQEIGTASAESTTTTQAIVSWLTASEGLTDKITVWTNNSIFSTTYKFSGKTKVHRHLLTGLKPATQYYWYVRTSMYDGIDGSIEVQSPSDGSTSFWSNGDPNTNPTPQLSFQVTHSTANRFSLSVSDTSGDALQFTITGLTFSQPGYAFSYAVAPLVDILSGNAQTFTVGYEGEPSSGSLSCQVTYSCYSVNGTIVTGTSGWLQLQ